MATPPFLECFWCFISCLKKASQKDEDSELEEGECEESEEEEVEEYDLQVLHLLPVLKPNLK